MTIAERVDRLRAELAREGLAGFLVPRTDEHQGEYVAPRAQRLAWLTGFTGSAGIAVVLADAAAIFVDGRYTLQARDETPGDVFEHHHVTDSPPSEWLRARLRPGDRLGYDPWLHTIESVERLQAMCGKVDAALVPVSPNLVDRIWADQPPPPRGPIVPHDQKHAGRPSPDKQREIAELLAKDGVDAVVLAAPDSIAWVLNIRGSDVAHTPVPLAFAVLQRDATVELFVDEAKLTPGLAEHLGERVRVLPAEETAGRVLADLEPGDIVVLHDGRPATEPPDLSWPTREATVEAVGLILAGMDQRGLRSVTISDLRAAD